MSFFTCKLRCHILDRRDQLRDAKSMLDYCNSELQEIIATIEEAERERDKLLSYMENRKSFIALVESTLDKDWIDRPDILEEEWFKENNNGV